MSSEDGQYFAASTVKLEQVKALLDSSIAKEKVDGLKRVIGMMSKGKDVSNLFPDVIKNVISPSLEVKKLVYVYLLQYAELKQDEALLSINTFQKDLADKNQFIRALALRVMSSIRNKMIVQIVVLAIKKCAADPSPYVRKSAAIAVPKVYALDRDHKDELVEVVAGLLRDTSTVVLGSAMFAFSEVCPERTDLLHLCFRKLCHLVVDCDEWGQCLIINTLLRYGRTQFLNPFGEESTYKKKQAFYSDDEEEEEEKEMDGKKKKRPTPAPVYDLDSDHRLLLKNTAPLLQSRNTAVVMSVASLYFHLAPPSELGKVAKALVRVLRGPRETQFVVLTNIASMAASRPDVFRSFLKDFFVGATDPAFLRTPKLHILTSLADETNISTVLKELKTYLKHADTSFVTETIQALGRVAVSVPDVAEPCLSGLLSLLSSKNEAIVAEAVVVIRHLTQSNPEEHHKVIKHLAKLIDKITVPVAKASIVWMLGEYYEKVPKLAPDVLRQLAKTFITEDDIVKMQVVTLAAKLYLHDTSNETFEKLLQYVLALSRYDMNYDIRDRGRLLKVLLFDPSSSAEELHERAAEIVLATKPPPIMTSAYAERTRFALGSMSHAVDHSAYGYQALPDFPESQPNPKARDPPDTKPADSYERAKGKKEKGEGKPKKAQKEHKDDLDAFYASSSEEEEEEESEEEGSEEGSSSEEGSGSEDESSSEEGSDEESESEDDSEEESEEESSEEEKPKRGSRRKQESSSEESSSEEDSDESEEESESEDSEEERRKSAAAAKRAAASKATPVKTASKKKGAAASVDLLDLSDLTLSDPVVRPSPGFPVAAMSSSPGTSPATMPYAAARAAQLPRQEILNHVNSNGLSIECQFARQISLYGSNFNLVRLFVRNMGRDTLSQIHVGSQSSDPEVTLIPFAEIPSLAPGAATEASMHVAFAQKTTPVKFEVWTSHGQSVVSLAPPIGELVRGIALSPADFQSQQSKLGGMHEHTSTLARCVPPSEVPDRVAAAVNTAPVSENESSGLFRYAAQTLTGDHVLLLSIEVSEDEDEGIHSAKLRLNCENSIYAAVLTKALKAALKLT